MTREPEREPEGERERKRERDKGGWGFIRYRHMEWLAGHRRKGTGTRSAQLDESN